MLEALISSQTRIKLLLRLFLNPNSTAYLRGMAEEFHESTNAVRMELNRFEDAGMLIAKNEGNKKIYKANAEHPLFKDINNIVLKYFGIDKIIDNVIKRTGNLNKVYLTGDYAVGKDSGIIDLLFIGEIDKNYLTGLISKVESLIGKKVRYLTYEKQEWEDLNQKGINYGKNLLIWESNDIF
jgi:hypothetical protein